MSTNDDALVARLVPKVLAAIRARSTAAESLLIKDNLDGIASMPCYDTTGGQYRRVLVSMPTLAKVSINASIDALESIDGERQANEKVRVANENQRIANEEGRQEQFDIWAEHGVNHPKIGENGNWWFWSEAESKYIDSDVLAQGGLFLPTLAVNDSMELTLTSGNVDLGGFFYDSSTGELLYTRE